jgi:hypothetical protein
MGCPSSGAVVRLAGWSGLPGSRRTLRGTRYAEARTVAVDELEQRRSLRHFGAQRRLDPRGGEFCAVSGDGATVLYSDGQVYRRAGRSSRRAWWQLRELSIDIRGCLSRLGGLAGERRRTRRSGVRRIPVSGADSRQRRQRRLSLTRLPLVRRYDCTYSRSTGHQDPCGHAGTRTSREPAARQSMKRLL